MKRRTFVQTGVAGVLGFALQPAGLRFVTPNQPHIQSWLSQFSERINATHISASRTLSTKDLQMTASLDAYFSKRYFQRENNRVYVVSNTEFSYFFYPVFLRRSVAGLCDLLLPVFMRSNDQQPWQHIVTLTGFQVEALARAAATLPGSDLGSILLPVGPGSTDGPVYSYKSRTGSVSISTVVKDRGTTTMRIYKEGQLVLEEHFISAHCLNGSNS